MNILALVEGVDHVCCRYRIAAFRPHLEAAGHTLTISALPKGIGGRLRMYSGAREADLVILQRKLLSRFEVAWLRRRARRLVFDFDDAIWQRDSHSGKGFADPKRTRRFRAIAEAADILVAGNPILAGHGRGIIAPSRVVEIPTCIDVGKYEPVEPVGDGAIRLVWIGSSSTLTGLETRRPLFEALGQSIPDLRMKVICNRFPRFDHLPVDEVFWSAATEAAELASADIGIGWVPDDPWSHGKCALKLLQYHAAGLPVVANPVGVQAQIVRPGINGYLATTQEQWIGAIRALAGDAQLRRRLGTAGREQVRNSYSVDVGGAAWVKLIAGMGQGTPC